jgi:glucokinase
MKQTIGIDIGATKISFVLLEKRKAIKKKKIATPKTKAKFIQEIKNNLKDFPKTNKIGLAVAGILDFKKRVVLESPNLKYLNNFPLIKVLEKELKAKIVMENDANCFALAEAILGAGKNKNIVLGITLGSGLGGGLVINKKIYQGAFKTAIEPGHQTINFNGPKCICGNIGCWEEYCSAKFFKRKGFSAQKLAEKAKQKDKKALAIFQEYGKYLGIGLVNIIDLIEPEIIVIGGGISQAWPYFLKEAKKETNQRVISPLAKKYTKIEISKWGEFSGAIGAGVI